MSDWLKDLRDHCLDLLLVMGWVVGVEGYFVVGFIGTAGSVSNLTHKGGLCEQLTVLAFLR